MNLRDILHLTLECDVVAGPWPSLLLHAAITFPWSCMSKTYSTFERTQIWDGQTKESTHVDETRGRDFRKAVLEPLDVVMLHFGRPCWFLMRMPVGSIVDDSFASYVIPLCFHTTPAFAHISWQVCRTTSCWRPRSAPVNSFRRIMGLL